MRGVGKVGVLVLGGRVCLPSMQLMAGQIHRSRATAKQQPPRSRRAAATKQPPGPLLAAHLYTMATNHIMGRRAMRMSSASCLGSVRGNSVPELRRTSRKERLRRPTASRRKAVEGRVAGVGGWEAEVAKGEVVDRPTASSGRPHWMQGRCRPRQGEGRGQGHCAEEGRQVARPRGERLPARRLGVPPPPAMHHTRRRPPPCRPPSRAQRAGVSVSRVSSIAQGVAIGMSCRAVM